MSLPLEIGHSQKDVLQLSLRAKTTFCIVKVVSECFPGFLEFPSYLEKIQYVRGIKNNQAFISCKYQNS